MTRSRSHLMVAVALCGLLAGCGGGGGTESGSDSREFMPLALLPLDAGNRWVYAREPLGNADIVVEAVGPATGNGQSGTLLRTLHYDTLDQQAVATVETSLMVASAGAVTQVPLAGADPLSAAIGAIDLLRGPVRVGDRFEQFDVVVTTIDLDGDTVPDRTRVTAQVDVLAQESITVPAGRFDDALKVRTVLVQTATASATGQSVRIEATDETWFAPGIGIVRHRIDVEVGGQPYSSVQRSLKAYGLADRRSESLPPAVVSVEPAGDGPARITPSLIEISVDERLDVFSLPDRLLLQDTHGVKIPGRIRQLGNPRGPGFLVQFEPEVSTLPSGDYTLTVSADTIDMVGNRLGADVVTRYRIDSDAPRLATSQPGAAATGISIDASIELRFDEPIRFFGGYGPASGVALRESGTDYVIEASLATGEDTIRIDPSLPLERGTAYQLSLDTRTVADHPGNPLAQPVLLSFTTDPGWYGRPESTIENSFGAVLADTDGDGRLDIAAWTVQPGASIAPVELVTRRQLPDGTLSTPMRSGVLLDRPCHVLGDTAAGDMNADGRIDLVVTDGCNVSVLLQRPDGSLEPVLRTVVPGGYRRLRVADMDGDGRDDIVLHAGFTTASLDFHVWRQMADGSFARQEVIAEIGNTPELRSFELADVDGNGRLDLVALATDGDPFVYRHVVLLQQAGGGFDTPLTLRADTGTHLGVADIDGNGRADLFAVGGGNSTGQIEWVRLSAGGVLEKVALMLIRDTPQRIAFADADGDGRLDVLIAHSGGGGLGVLRQSSGGSLEAEAIYRQGEGASGDRLATGDLNGDGRVDVLFDDHWQPSLIGGG